MSDPDDDPTTLPDISSRYGESGSFDKDIPGIPSTETTISQAGRDVTVCEVYLENDVERQRSERRARIAAVHATLGLVELVDEQGRPIFVSLRTRRLEPLARELRVDVALPGKLALDPAALHDMARRIAAAGALIAPPFTLAVPPTWEWSAPAPTTNYEGWLSEHAVIGERPGPAIRCERRRSAKGGEALVLLTLEGLRGGDEGFFRGSSDHREPAVFWFRCHPLQHAALRVLLVQ